MAEQEPGRRERQWWKLAGVLIVLAGVAIGVAMELGVERVAFTEGMIAGRTAARIAERVRQEELHD